MAKTAELRVLNEVFVPDERKGAIAAGLSGFVGKWTAWSECWMPTGPVWRS